ncbi:acyl-CoA dehydrogenase family protein [Sphingomonas oligophenolica]|uniref:Acyl-CoA dehydrogenase family protein n=1 Tax=Sphingomonas oligophenolica TaxID=301154 RepID=A0ABU9XY80_9SPHN
MSMTRAELQDAARQAFGDRSRDAETTWQLIGEMGWLMMTVPEALGGLGLGTEAAAVIHNELGRALVPGPAIAQMLVIEALCATGGRAGRDVLLAEAMAGRVMTTSLAGRGNANLTCIPDADRASHLLLVDSGRVSLVLLDGAILTARETWDKTRRLFDVALDGPEALVIAEGDAAAALSERLEAQLLLALAGDSLGGADAILSITIDYLKMRRQFDRPLAMFQALKHRVADMKTRLAAAEALYWVRAGVESVPLAEIGALKALATGVYRTIAEEAVQLHGGIGLTIEHECHLFLKRALLNCALGGDADRHEERAGRHFLATTPG